MCCTLVPGQNVVGIAEDRGNKWMGQRSMRVKGQHVGGGGKGDSRFGFQVGNKKEKKNKRKKESEEIEKEGEGRWRRLIYCLTVIRRSQGNH